MTVPPPPKRYTQPMRVYAFDDDLGDLSPLTDLRPSFEVRTGAMTALERLTAVVGGDRLVGRLVPDRLAATTAETHGHPVSDRPRGTEAVLLVNGRWVLPDRALLSLGPGRALVVRAASVNERELARRLRIGVPAVVGRVKDGALWLDLRTVFRDQDESLVKAMRAALS